MVKSVYINKQLVKNDSDKLLLISGPCLLENEKLVRKVAANLIKYTKKYYTDLIFTLIQFFDYNLFQNIL